MFSNGAATGVAQFMDGGGGNDTLGWWLRRGCLGRWSRRGSTHRALTVTIVLYVECRRYLIEGSAGYDRLFVSAAGDFTLDLSAHSIEFAWGNSGRDVFNGAVTTTNQYLRGAGGSDTILGGSGWDYVIGDAGSDDLFGLAGNDAIYAGMDDGNS